MSIEEVSLETSLIGVLPVEGGCGLRTGDIMQPGKTLVSTRAMGDAILKELDRSGG